MRAPCLYTEERGCAPECLQFSSVITEVRQTVKVRNPTLSLYVSIGMNRIEGDEGY